MNQIIEGKTQAKIPSRRVVLRGALAVGCGLLLPAALFGCEKKNAGSTGAAPESSPPPSPEAAAPQSSPATGAGSAAPVASAKVSKASVKYQTEPKGDQQCSGCLNFIAESNTCKLVEGPISPSGWCTLWTKKT